MFLYGKLETLKILVRSISTTRSSHISDTYTQMSSVPHVFLHVKVSVQEVLSVCIFIPSFCYPHNALFCKQDFIQSQGRRVKLRLELRGSLNNIFSDLSKSFTEGNIGPKSAVAADIVSVGDSWLSLAIRKGLIVALQGVEDHDWFRGLDDKWKVRIQSDLYGPFYTPTLAM